MTFRTRRKGLLPPLFRFLAAPISMWFFVSCNVGGYADLGRKLDTLVSIGEQGATAWMKTDSEGANDILVLGDLADSDTGRFALMHILPDSTGTLRAGTYTIEPERIVLYVESEYRKIAQLEVPPSGREGSVREDFNPPTAIPCEAAVVDEKLRITLDGKASVMTNMWDVISSVDPAEQDGSYMLCRFFNLSTVSLQMRIPGFGGAGLLQYAGERSWFAGVIGGAGAIEMLAVLNPVAEITFDDYRDYPGITLQGAQISTTDISGDGTLSDKVYFTMQDPSPEGDFDITGEIEYDLILRNGISSGGGYHVTLSNGTVDYVPYQEGETLDFRSILPPS